MRRRLLLVQPRFENEALDRNKGTIPPLGLAYIAAYTPEHWEVEILDEQVEPTRLPEVDLVGISTTTLTVHRAYELADHYRRRGVPVVLGGVHASMLPEEALERADSVVVGDAEPVWEELVADFEAGRLKARYDAPIADLCGLRLPRTDLFRARYSFAPVSASRGCPFRCEFCAINKFYRQTYRRRPAEEVVSELARRGPVRVFFTDGNLYGYTPRDREFFIELCRGIIRERARGAVDLRHWMCYASVNALDDEEALALAAAAGCRALFVGFESIDPAALKEMGKVVNLRYGPESYSRLIGRAHRHRLVVVGEIVVGSDCDTPESLERTAEFIMTSGIDILRLQILQPLPGTDLFARLQREGRLRIADFPGDWRRLAADFVMGVHYATRGVAPHALQDWVARTGKRFYSNRALVLRLLKIAARTRGLLIPALVLANSLKSRRTYFNFRPRRDAEAARSIRSS